MCCSLIPIIEGMLVLLNRSKSTSLKYLLLFIAVALSDGSESIVRADEERSTDNLRT